MSAPTADFHLGDRIVVHTRTGPVEGRWVSRSPMIGRAVVKLPDAGGFLVQTHVDTDDVQPAEDTARADVA